jgi:beta-1,4-mannosyl-glycoprotein beta-1,4-N-acetylglucosaminyltransferase
MLIDVVLYSGIGAEEDLLRLRMEELAGVIDALVVIEGSHTFSGIPREAKLSGQKIADLGGRFAPPRIEHVRALLPHQAGVRASTRDDTQRDQGLSTYVYGPDGIWPYVGEQETETLFLLGDLDEIPRAELVVSGMTRARQLDATVRFVQRQYWYYLDCRHPELWYGTQLLTARRFREHYDARWSEVRADLGGVWLDAEHETGPGMAGWHFTYQGGADAVLEKLRSAAHPEIDTQEIRERVPAAVAEGVDFRTAETRGDQLYSVIETLDELPWCVAAEPARWAHLLSPERRRTATEVARLVGVAD